MVRMVLLIDGAGRDCLRQKSVGAESMGTTEGILDLYPSVVRFYSAEHMYKTDSISTLIFDWDGTLVDSAKLGLNAFQKTFAELEFAFPLDVYEANYSPNWYTTYEALGLPKEKWQIADDLWLQHYGTETAKLIEGVGETLLELTRRNYRLAVVSSGSEPRVCREIAESVLRDSFDAVVCNEHIVNKKPDPEGLNLALQHLHCGSHEAAYVGDAPQDIEMGKAANVFTIGVKSNYPGSARLPASAPDMYLDTITELSSWFK
jgi:HAD superfamily hydrolase (TIGR01509 family)